MLKKAILTWVLLGVSAPAIAQGTNSAQSVSAPHKVQAHNVQEEVPLRLEIKLNKATYVLGEPIVLSATVTNTGDEPLDGAWFRIPEHFNVSLEDASGTDRSIQHVSDGSVSWGDVSIPPHSAAMTDLDIVVGDILEVSGVAPNAESRNFGKEPYVVSYYSLRPGTYTLKLRLNVSASTPRYERRFQRELTTRATFEVRKPYPEERAALELFKFRPYMPAPSYSLKEEMYPGVAPSQLPKALRSWATTRSAFETLLRDYSKTPYAPYALYYVGRIAQAQRQWQDAVKAYEQLLRERPLFPLKADILYYLANCYLDAGQREQARDVFTTLKNLTPSRYISPSVTYFALDGRLSVSRLQALEKRLDTAIARSTEATKSRPQLW